MENKSSINTNYSKLLNKHTSVFNQIMEEFRTDGKSEMNPSFTVIKDGLAFSKTIGMVIPDITPIRYEIMGRIEAAQIAFEDEHLEKIHYHVKEALDLWISIVNDLEDFEKSLNQINSDEILKEKLRK